MSTPANRAQFRLRVADWPTELRVLAFRAHEALSELYQIELEVVASVPDLDLDDLINRDSLLIIDGAPHRLLHGTIRRARQGATSKRFTYYHLTLAPRLAWLDLRHNVRIFQQQSVPDIVRQLLNEAGIKAPFHRFELSRDYPPRTYCVQYNESELQFIERLLTEEGIHYHFEHFEDRHVLVLADHGQAFRALKPDAIALRGDAAMVGEPCIQSFVTRRSAVTDAVALTDYDFHKPNRSLFVQASGPDARLPSYRWPGRYHEPTVGDTRSSDQLHAYQLPRQPATGKSNVPTIMPGGVFQLTQHPRADLNRDYFVTWATHQGRQPQVLEEFAGTEGSSYHNEFGVLPGDQVYRPIQRHARPMAQPQTAVVIGPPGEPIYTNEHGQVQVRFHWDRDAKHACWIRVSQAWAGAFWGSLALPRVGQEVMVDFLNGDPDHPLITGTLYHGTNKPPYPLPDHKSRTLLRSQSLAGGDGHELMLEDLAGQEKIAVHSARDLEIHVTQDSKTSIGNQNHTHIGGDRITTLQGTLHETVQGERRVKISSQDSLDVGQALHLKTSTAIHLQSGQGIHLKAGMKAALAAGMEVVLKVGGSSLVLNPAGVTVNAPVINLTGGASAGAAGAASPKAPEVAAKLGEAKAGQEALPPAQTSQSIPKIEFIGHQLKQASLSSQALVELCQMPPGGTPKDCPLPNCACR